MTNKHQIVTITFEEILTKQITVEVPAGINLYKKGKSLYRNGVVQLDKNDLQTTQLMVETDTEAFDWEEI